MAGFEPTRVEPIGFQVQRLNHSATTALIFDDLDYRTIKTYVNLNRCDTDARIFDDP